MKRRDLLAYDEAERDHVRAVGHDAVSNGYVTDAPAIYRDKLLPGRLGFHRGGAPLGAELLLYPSVVVYIPPTSRENVEKRLGLPWASALELIDRRCITPVIGHPEHYANRGMFDDLFALRPASIWSRGDELAHRFANAASHWEQARASLPAYELASVPWVRHKFRGHFPNASESALTERIATELWTNYVDLCIFGYEPLAEAAATIDDHVLAARALLQASEHLTYPMLLGMGGTPNYRLSELSAIELARDYHPRLGSNVSALGPEAAILTDGLELKFPRLSARDVIDFHRDGMSERLWAAMGGLEATVAEKATDPDDMIEAAATAQAVLTEALRDVRSAAFAVDHRNADEQARRSTDLTLKIGSTIGLTSIIHGAVGLEWIAAAALGLGVARGTWSLKTWDRLTQRAEDHAARVATSRRTNRLAAQLWWLSEWSEKRR